MRLNLLLVVSLFTSLALARPDYQPVTDTADFKYVLLSSYTAYNPGQAPNLRYTIAQNLPEDVKLVLLIPRGDADIVRAEYAPYIAAERLILVETRRDLVAGGFWARDSFPFPVVNSRGELELVSAQYPNFYNGGVNIAAALNVPLHKNDFTFVGGNLLADEEGTCFTVSGPRSYDTTAYDLRNSYGCKDVVELEHFSGIGDVDEVIKPIGNGIMLTNTEAYVSELQGRGFRIVRLPSLPGFRTYVNSVIIGKTVFMPTYGVSTDAEAQEIYESLGYKVVGIRSVYFSDRQNGSIHCQTMAYPAISENALLNNLGLVRAQ